MALHGELRYPAPQQETCALGTPSAELSVVVTDELGAVIPGATVYAAPMADRAAGVVTATTDDAGVARATLPAAGNYAVTILLEGFLPEARAFRIRAGCSGLTKVILRVGPFAVEW
jgi:hypothetical protein